MKCIIIVLMMALAYANAGIYRASTLAGTHQVELPGFPDVLIDNLSTAPGVQGPVIYRASTRGATHQVELPAGYTNNVLIDNLGVPPSK